MSLVIPFEDVTEADRPCVTVDAYRQYVRLSGLADRIRLELSRNRFADMRWEEIWDAALRISNMFLTAPLSQPLSRAISEPLLQRFGEAAVVVRSSAPDEDSSRASFAGLHEHRSISGAMRRSWTM